MTSQMSYYHTSDITMYSQQKGLSAKMDEIVISVLLDSVVDPQELNTFPHRSEGKPIADSKSSNKRTVQLAGKASMTHVPVVPQQVATPIAVGVQHVGIPSQHMHRHALPNATGGLIVQRPTQNDKTMFGRHQGAHFVPPNPAYHQGPHTPSSGTTAIPSPLWHLYGHHNQFYIPSGLSVNPSSVQVMQTINKQHGQIQPTYLGSHAIMNINTAAMVGPNQQYPVQLLPNPGPAVQVFSGQTFAGSAGKGIMSHGPSKIVVGGGQMSHISPTVLYLPPGQGNRAKSSTMLSTPSHCPNTSAANRFVVLQSMGPPLQSLSGRGNHSAGKRSHRPAASAVASNSFPYNGSQQSFPCYQVEGRPGGLKRPATKQLTREALLLQQLHKDQECSVLPDKSKFHSLQDAAERLLPYHVFQGSLPTEEDLHKVDAEFETASTHLLKKAHALRNKYRMLLTEDAMRISPSAEMLMVDRIFNQEERDSLIRDKQMVLYYPDGYLAEFCCATQYKKNV